MRYLLPLLLLLTACSSAPAATPTLASMVDEPSTPTPSSTPTPLPSCDPNMPYDVLTEEMLTYKEYGEVTTTTETRFASGGDHHSVIYDEEGNVTYQELWKDGMRWYKFGDQDWDEIIGGGGDQSRDACGPIPHESGYFAKGLWLYRHVGDTILDGETVRHLESVQPFEQAGQKIQLWVNLQGYIVRTETEFDRFDAVGSAVLTTTGFGEPNDLPDPAVKHPTPTPTPGMWGSRRVEVTPRAPTPTPSATPIPTPTTGPCDCDGDIPVDAIYEAVEERYAEQRFRSIDTLEMTLDSAEWGIDEGEYVMIVRTCELDDGERRGIRWTATGTWDADCRVYPGGGQGGGDDSICGEG